MISAGRSFTFGGYGLYVGNNAIIFLFLYSFSFPFSSLPYLCLSETLISFRTFQRRMGIGRLLNGAVRISSLFKFSKSF